MPVSLTLLALGWHANHHRGLNEPYAPSSARRRVARLQTDDRQEPSWQENLESVLRPDTPPDDRQILLKDLVARSSEIASDVTSAITTGKIEALLPPRLAESVTTVRRQVEEDILPKVVERASEPQSWQELAAAAAMEVQAASARGPAAAASFIQDPARALELARQEMRNTVSSDPEGLETPPFSVVKKGEGFEVREYKSYAVVETAMDASAAGGDDDDILSQLQSSSQSFGDLAFFIFGGNARSEQLGMTTPVRVDVDADLDTATMSFSLSSEYTAATAPPPTDASIRLLQRPAETLAVAEFVGFATEGEVAIQRSALVDRLDAAGIQIIDQGTRYSVLQYNPPYTLPWLRRNEIAIPVALTAEDTVATEDPEEVAETASAVEDGPESDMPSDVNDAVSDVPAASWEEPADVAADLVDESTDAPSDTDG